MTASCLQQHVDDRNYLEYAVVEGLKQGGQKGQRYCHSVSYGPLPTGGPAKLHLAQNSRWILKVWWDKVALFPVLPLLQAYNFAKSLLIGQEIEEPKQ